MPSSSSSGTTSYMGTFNVDPLVTQDTIFTERSEQLKLRNVHSNVPFRDSVSNSEPQTSSGHSSNGEGNLIDDSIGSERQIIGKEGEGEGEAVATESTEIIRHTTTESELCVPNAQKGNDEDEVLHPYHSPSRANCHSHHFLGYCIDSLCLLILILYIVIIISFKFCKKSSCL